MEPTNTFKLYYSMTLILGRDANQLKTDEHLPSVPPLHKISM